MLETEPNEYTLHIGQCLLCVLANQKHVWNAHYIVDGESNKILDHQRNLYKRLVLEYNHIRAQASSPSTENGSKSQVYNAFSSYDHHPDCPSMSFF